MNAYFSRLNPTERRFVIGVGLLFFAVINIFWVRPHFADWGNLNRRLDAANQKLASDQALIRQRPTLETDVKRLSGGEGDVLPEDQSIRFLQTIQSQGFKSGISFNFPSRQIASSNQFFIEQAQTISVTANEKALVDFLYNIGSGNSLIRARAMSLRPDQNHYALNANITLVASYQRKPKAPTARTTATAPAVNAPGPASLRPTGPPVRLTNSVKLTNSAPKLVRPAPGLPTKPSDPKAAPTPKK
jgi:Tfp pilus assembly protein PilO